ncbi:hypothetical protein HYT54_01445 [Candidatus Woesearchaeota archaeon]|nr:hypothetical protein [Candidatus Woesearchaeota archaeon]
MAATGTINSGGVIGPVGGLREKIGAASRAGLRKALIPFGESIKSEGNESLDMGGLSRELGIEITEISTLSEAIYQFTGKDLEIEYPPISIDKEYASTMESLSVELCRRSDALRQASADIESSANITELLESALNGTQRGKNAFDSGEFYSSASYCFGANVEFGNVILIKQNASKA